MKPLKPYRMTPHEANFFRDNQMSKALILTSIVIVALSLSSSNSFAQSIDAPSAQKIDEFGNTNADDEEAYLDILAEALGKSTDSRGYIIGYTEQRFPPGNFLRRLYGYRDYLVDKRGIDPNRIVVIKGGNKNKLIIELWLASKGALAPKPDSEYKIIPILPLKFDTIFPDCPSEFSIYLEGIKDYLRFYAKALNENPNMQSRIIVYPKQRGRLTKAMKIARDTRNLLIKDYGISAHRITATAGNPHRGCTEIELWIIPKRTL